MLTGVKDLGNAIEVTVGGSAGPETHRPEKGEVLRVFQFAGWDANTEAEGPEDERVGNELARKMTLVGKIWADDKLDAVEAEEMAAFVWPDVDGTKDLAKVMGVVSSIIKEYKKDGNVSWVDWSSILFPLLAEQLAGDNLVAKAKGLIENLFKKKA